MASPNSRPHSRKTSTSSTSSTYRLFPRCPKPSAASSPPPTARTHARHTSFCLGAPTTNSPPTSPLSSSNDPSNNTQLLRRHTLPVLSSLPMVSTHHLTTSIERSTIPVLAHLAAQLPHVQQEQERVKVQSMIQRQASVLVLSRLLRGWDGEEEEEEESWESGSEGGREVWEDAVEVVS